MPLVRTPDIELEEIDASGQVTLTVTATPLDSGHGQILASQVLEAIRTSGGVGTETDPRGEPAVREPERARRDSAQPGYGGD